MRSRICFSVSPVFFSRPISALLMVGWPFSLRCKIKSTAESESPTSRSMTASPLVLVRAANQSYASIVGNSSLFQSYELRDFHIGGVQSFQLLDVAGPHPRLVERTIIRERMFFASTRPEEDEHTEKHELVPHDSIVARTTRKTGWCAVRGTRAKGQVADTGPIVDGKNVFSAAINLPEQESQAINISVARLVDAFDAQNARNFLYVDENGFELAL